MSAAQDSPVPETESSIHELFGGIAPDASPLPESPAPASVPAASELLPSADRDDPQDAAAAGDDEDVEPPCDEPEVIAVGRYRLRRGAQAIPLLDDEDGTFQETLLMQTLQPTTVEHRLWHRRRVPSFLLQGRWCVVSMLEMPALVRVDDLIPVEA